MIINIEVTTHCNFDCAYCYTNKYPNKMISFDLFKQLITPYIIQHTRTHPHELRLVGEGEPLLHPQFWEMVDYIKTKSSHRITTITNGSIMTERHQNNIIKYLDWIRISIDTTNVELAEKIGRHNIDKVILNLRQLVSKGYKNINLISVDFGQYFRDVKLLAMELGIRHESQPLQTKADSRANYNQHELLNPPVINYPSAIKSITCMYINKNIMRFYAIDGVERPCCFIKDASTYISIVDTAYQMSNKIIPNYCNGCKYLNVS